MYLFSCTNTYRSPRVCRVDWSRHIAFSPYGERWKNQRQLMHTSFHKTAVRQHWPTLTKHVRQAAVRIMENPTNFVAELTRYSIVNALSTLLALKTNLTVQNVGG